MKSNLSIYCDGACSNNPGPGAWAYVAFENNTKIVANACGIELHTTNNQMELMAAIKAVEAFDNCTIILDSQYVQRGITEWINVWEKNGWKTKKGMVKNLNLWQKLHKLNKNKNIQWQWQKGHAKTLHDYADLLARNSVIQLNTIM